MRDLYIGLFWLFTSIAVTFGALAIGGETLPALIYFAPLALGIIFGVLYLIEEHRLDQMADE